MNPQVHFGSTPYNIGLGLTVDAHRNGIFVYDDRGELEMLGRTVWLEVAFGSGWALHALTAKTLANETPQGVVLENSGRSMDLKLENCRYRVDDFY